MPFTSIESAKAGQFITVINDIPLTLAQVNHLARIHDSIKATGDVKVPMAVAIAAFKKAYEVKEGKWARKEAAMSEELMEMLTLETINELAEHKLFEVEKEILRTGNFTDMNGQKLTVKENDLEDMVSAFNDNIRPDGIPLKLGHGGEVREGYPAIGWVKSLKRVGDRLIAKIADIPKLIKEFIESKSYRNVSVEMTSKHFEQGYSLVLKALGLLGEDLPAVPGLNAFAKFFKNETDDKSHVLEFELENGKIKLINIEEESKLKEERIMEKKLEQLNEEMKGQIAGLTDKLKSFEDKDIKLGEEKKTLESENKRLKEESELREKKAKEEKIELFLKSDDIVKRIIPAQTEDYKLMMISMDKDRLEKKIEEIKGYPEIIKFEEKSGEGKSEKEVVIAEIVKSEIKLSQGGETIKLENEDIAIKARKLVADGKFKDSESKTAFELAVDSLVE